MTVIELYFRLAWATAVVLAPGWLLARALGVRGAAATLAWSLALLFGALLVAFALESSLTLVMALLAAASACALGVLLWRGRRRWPRRGRDGPPVPGQWWAASAGALMGMLLWSVAGRVQGDGLFHLARARKILELDGLTLEGVGEFEDGSLHPGYAFPLWHGFLALVSRVAGADPGLVVLHLPSILAVLAVALAYEVGWALFRRTWAAGAVAGTQLALYAFAAGDGGAYRVLSLPATSSEHLLVPAALALALTCLRSPSPALLASTGAASLALAVVHPTYALFLWIPFTGFLLVRALWTRSDLRAGALVLGALVVPAALFVLWLLPVATDTASVTPDDAEVRRALEQYQGQLDVRSESSYSLAPEVFSRRGAVAIAALCLVPLAGLAARRRWSAYVVGGALGVFAVTLVPFVFTAFSDLVSLSQARRLAGFFPFAFAFVGGLAVLRSLVGAWLAPLALAAGIVLQIAYPGDFEYALTETAPALFTWIAVAGAAAALIVGAVGRGSLRESPAAFAAALFLFPVVASGIATWAPPPAAAAGELSPGLVQAVRETVPDRAVVYSDQETSYLLHAAAPIYVAVAPPGHVADTDANRPRERARDARVFLRTGDLAIPERYGADFLVIARTRTTRTFDLPELYRDDRFVLYRMPPPSSAGAP